MMDGPNALSRWNEARDIAINALRIADDAEQMDEGKRKRALEEKAFDEMHYALVRIRGTAKRAQEEGIEKP